MENKRRNIDLLVEHFWKHGYLTLSRKFGTYLPEPKRMGEFDIDIIARYKNDYAIGIYLSPEELDSPSLQDKLTFLATRQTKFTSKKVLLFIGVPELLRKKARFIMDCLKEDIRKNIRIYPIVDKELPSPFKKKKQNIFS